VQALACATEFVPFILIQNFDGGGGGSGGTIWRVCDRRSTSAAGWLSAVH